MLTVEFLVEYDPHVRTIQVVLEENLLWEATRAARRLKVNRSALIREALREHLQRLQAEQKERQDREGYERYPDTEPDLNPWERVAVWPPE